MCQYVYRTLAVGHHCAGHVYRTLAVVLHVTCTMRTSVTGPGMCTARWLLYYVYYAYLSYWAGHVYRTLAVVLHVLCVPQLLDRACVPHSGVWLLPCDAVGGHDTPCA